MRPRTWIAVIGLGVGLLLSVIARPLDSTALEFLAGLGFLIGLGAAVSLLPFWERLGLRLPPMGALFVRPRAGETWSAAEGRPVVQARKRRASRSERS